MTHPTALPEPDAFELCGLITRCASVQRVLEHARLLARSDQPLLLLGEPGTGKRALARALHREGPREAFPLFATPASGLLDAPGERDGAAPAAIERARGGTLLLEDAGALQSWEQARLLRDLRAACAALGDAAPRLVLLAERSLAEDLRRGALRLDLCHRLGLQPIFLPALRDRPGDIPLLTSRILARLGPGRQAPQLEPEALELLEAYDYPGNVAELEAVLAWAVAHRRGGTLGRRSLPPWVAASVARAALGFGSPPSRSLEEVEVEHLRRVLQHTRGNRSAAARILGITRVGLLGKMRRYGIEIPPEGSSSRERPDRALA